MNEQFLSAAAQYDPLYMEKVRKVVTTINEKLYKNQDFTTFQLGVHLDFDCYRHLRMLCRRGYITQGEGTTGRSAIYLRSGSWPPPADFFEAENFGFTGYLQTWFRYLLKVWVDNTRTLLEAKEGVYSLDFRTVVGDEGRPGYDCVSDIARAASFGEYTEPRSRQVVADVTGIQR